MPGVPSSRGCEACRKQKKKVGLYHPPLCSSRSLQSNGQQRYKFKEQMVIRGTPIRSQGSLSPSKVPHSPSSEGTATASALVTILDITDVRYELTYYGEFLKDIPRRLGTNDVLDASVTALTYAYPSLRTSQPSPEALNKYVNALKTLRLGLQDPVKMRTMEALCGIYLIVVCQSWLCRNDDKCVNHGEPMAQLLHMAVMQNWQGSFTNEMLLTFSIIAIFESTFNPNIQLEPWLGKLAERIFSTRPQRMHPYPSLHLQNFANISTYVREPEFHVFEIESAYKTMLVDLPKLRRLVDKTTGEIAAAEAVGSSPITLLRLLTRYQAMYGMLLAFAIILNRMLREFDPDDVVILQNSGCLFDQLMSLAHEACRHRPIGASYMPLCLVAAWAASTDASQRVQAEAMIADYQSDFKEVRWLEMAVWLARKLDTLRLKLAPLGFVGNYFSDLVIITTFPLPTPPSSLTSLVHIALQDQQTPDLRLSRHAQPQLQSWLCTHAYVFIDHTGDTRQFS
ncbi:uncharacterized protein ATNIH1004_009639 [Aspergillus tanneri]|uniref:Transcription factor domain-containing protein n=1 Tax=Aspergillus tanneri TaxID=1220188 RepID=A0A5M9MBS0_9EURO|nr:uncharacterized protein ATNIH1004_009639 [Aspergillus tanneri]KAA8642880.1 hypothetical protein ATNIH1004_009639 [Aspergillus tanneri]